LKNPFRFRGIRAKIALILAIGGGAAVATYFFGFFAIQSMLLIGYVAGFLAILFWEREKRENAFDSRVAVTSDERWVYLKKKIERLEKQSRRSSEPERQILLAEKRSLENELRRVEWKVRESSLTEMYNAGMGNLKRDGKGNPAAEGEEDTSLPRRESKSHRGGEQEREERKALERIIDYAETVLVSENPDSLKIALAPVLNETRAHYNAIRSRRRKSGVVTDYWVVWAILASVVNCMAVDPKIISYSSPSLKQKMEKLLTSARAHDPIKPHKELSTSEHEEESDSELQPFS
jgi:hypothetical protein